MYKNSIIYCRISTKGQTFGFSLEQQNYTCLIYCNNNNYNIINTIYEIGRATNLNNLKKLVNILENNNNINIIISDATRLCRNINDFNYIVNICKKNNIIIHDIHNNIITTNTNNIIYFMNKIKQGETESLILSKRIKKSIEYRKSINKFIPSIARFGLKFTFINNKKMIAINNKEQIIIKLFSHLYHKKKFRHLIKKYHNKKIINTNIKPKCISDIVNFFNKNKILNRNKEWSYQSIKKLLNYL
jgi:DNA invertase Pin-like site-specific DNA recombinase